MNKDSADDKKFKDNFQQEFQNTFFDKDKSDKTNRDKSDKTEENRSNSHGNNFDFEAFLSANLIGPLLFQETVHSHGKALFKVFSKQNPIPQNSDNDEIGFVFLNWLNWVLVDYRRSYSYWGYSLHIYYTWYSLAY